MKVHGGYSADEAESYDAVRRGEPLWDIEAHYIASLTEQLRPAAVLDIPIGTARFLEYFSDCEVVGVDLSKPMLEFAERRASALQFSELTLLEGTVTSIPLESKSFDLVVCWRLLHLLPPEDLPKALAEMARVCRGTLSIQAYVTSNWPRMAIAKTGRWIRRVLVFLRGGGPLTPWSHIPTFAHTRESLEEATKVAGLAQPDAVDHLGSYDGKDVIVLRWTIAQ